MLAERAARARAQLVEEEARHFNAIKAAFSEGWRAGQAWLDPKEAWRASAAHAALSPPLRRPGDGIRRLQHEWKLRSGHLRDEAYAARWWNRWDGIEGAFFEGHAVGAHGATIKEGWRYGQTRKSLYLGPPTPLHLRTLMRAQGGGFDPSRSPG